MMTEPFKRMRMNSSDMVGILLSSKHCAHLAAFTKGMKGCRESADDIFIKSLP